MGPGGDDSRSLVEKPQGIPLKSLAALNQNRRAMVARLQFSLLILWRPGWPKPAGLANLAPMHRHLAAWSTPISMSTRILVAATLLLAASLAGASVVEIVWDEAGRFQQVAELEAGDFAEVCGALSHAERIHWAFEASAALDFNIHYHVGDEVVYPTKFADTVERAGELVAPIDQTYCWMWKSGLPSPATVTLRLSH